MRKKFRSIFLVSLVKSEYSIPKTPTFTSFSSPILDSLDSYKFDFKPKKDENKNILFCSSFTETKFFKKIFFKSHLHKLYK